MQPDSKSRCSAGQTIKVKNTQNYMKSKVHGCFSLSVIWVTSVGELHVVCGSHGRAENIQGIGEWNGAMKVYSTDREITC